MARQVFRDRAVEERFARMGYVTLPFLTARECEHLEAVWHELGAPIHALGFSASVMSGEVGYRTRVSAEIGTIFAPRLAAMLHDYRFCFGNFVAKRAGAADGIPIHQDATFVDETQFESLNFWVTLGGVNRENGCLRVMPGSHGLNLAPRGTNRRFPYPELEALIAERYLTDVPMERGWACVMSQRMFHTSHPNGTGAHRICASALAVPQESTLLYLLERPGHAPGAIDVFEVDDAFYRLQVYGAPVPHGSPAAAWPAQADPITPERLHAAFEASGAAARRASP